MLSTAVTRPVNSAADGIPTRQFDVLWHVGSLRPAEKKDFSLEGQGLSVSLHPQEWAKIARLGGATWRLKKPNNAFLDYHALSESDRLEIAEWGIKQGYVRRSRVFAATWFDDEWEGELTALFATLEEALEQVDEAEECVTEREMLVATSQFPDRTVRVGDIDPFEVLCTLWAASVGLDGVWWEDCFDPERLSAPRGVILVERLVSWEWEPCALGILPH